MLTACSNHKEGDGHNHGTAETKSEAKKLRALDSTRIVLVMIILFGPVGALFQVTMKGSFLNAVFRLMFSILRMMHFCSGESC